MRGVLEMGKEGFWGKGVGTPSEESQRIAFFNAPAVQSSTEAAKKCTGHLLWS